MPAVPGFVRLLHQCRPDCQRAFGRHFRQQRQTDSLHGGFLLHLFRAASVVSHVILTAQLHTTLDTYVSITPDTTTPLPARISGVHALTFAMQRIGFISASSRSVPSLIFQRVVTCHQLFSVLLPPPSAQLPAPADCGMFRHPHGRNRQAPYVRRTIPSLRLPEGVPATARVFPAGRHRAPRGRHNRPRHR